MKIKNLKAVKLHILAKPFEDQHITAAGIELSSGDAIPPKFKIVSVPKEYEEAYDLHAGDVVIYGGVPVNFTANVFPEHSDWHLLDVNHIFAKVEYEEASKIISN